MRDRTGDLLEHHDAEQSKAAIRQLLCQPGCGHQGHRRDDGGSADELARTQGGVGSVAADGPATLLDQLDRA